MDDKRTAGRKEPSAAPGVFSLPPSKFASCLGIWAVFTWVYWFNVTPMRVASVQVPAWFGISGVMFVVQLTVALLWMHRAPAWDLKKLDVPIAVLMGATTVSVLAAGLLETKAVAWSVANIAAAGLCGGILYLRWTAFFARLGTRDAVACLFGAYLVSAVFKMLLDFAPPSLGAVLALALAAVSYGSLRIAGSLPWAALAEGSPQIMYQRGGYGALGRVVACVGVFCVVRQVALLAAGVQNNQFAGVMASHTIEIIFAGAVLAWVFIARRSLDFPQLWRCAFALLATAVLAECLLPGGSWSQLLLEVTTSFVWMLLWLLICDVARHCDRHPYVVAGLGWGVYTGGNYLGMLIVSLAGIQGLDALLGLVLVWGLGLATVFFLGSSTPDIQRIFADLHPQVVPEEFTSIDACCEKIARDTHLSARELDVLKMLAKGRSRAYIAEELYLSENTVRGHTSRIYTKLGVHTRDELQRLLGV